MRTELQKLAQKENWLIGRLEAIIITAKETQRDFPDTFDEVNRIMGCCEIIINNIKSQQKQRMGGS